MPIPDPEPPDNPYRSPQQASQADKGGEDQVRVFVRQMLRSIGILIIAVVVAFGILWVIAMAMYYSH